MRLGRERTEAAVAYAIGAVVSIVAAVFVLDLGKADLRVPFDYDGDGLLFSFIVKTAVDHGWTWTNASVGAPVGFDMHDFPVSAHDSAQLLVIKLMSLVTRDVGLLFNLYFLLGFPLIALSAMAVFRRFGVGPIAAIACGVLYAFLPSRLLKGEGHLFLDVFFQVPLAVLLMLWVAGDDPPLTRATGLAGEGWRGLRLDLRRRPSWIALALAVLVATTSLYYAFFAMILLVGAGVWGAHARRSWRNLVAGVGLAGVIAVGLGLQGLPTVVYHARHGDNAEVGRRQSREAELYALKITQLLLPSPGHRVPALARLERNYQETSPVVGESASTALGAVGVLGFLLLLGAALSGRRRAEADLSRTLGVLTLMAVLVGTLGGFGSLFAYLVTAQIRTYARLNVYIGFFALFAVALLLDRLARQRPRAAALVAAGVLGLGLYDQASLFALRPYQQTRQAYASDQAFVRRLEASLPAGAALFQLPVSSFPESASIHALTGYGPIRPYLHSRALRWSYPAMRGRGSDPWMQDVARREPAAMLEALSDADFEGVVISRQGYGDGAAALETALRQLLGVDAWVSGDGRLSYFPLTAYNRTRHAAESPEAAVRRRHLAAHPIVVTWGEGFYGMERDPGRTFRWSQAASELWLANAEAQPRHVVLRAVFAAAQAPATLEISGDLFTARLDLSQTGTPFERTLDVPPGRHRIRLRSDGRRAPNPADPRVLVFTAANLGFDER